jgi:hypothetical protein
VTAIKDVQIHGWLKDINDNFSTIGERGSHVATSAEATAGTLDIDTGKVDATAFIVQIWRSGVMVMEDAAVSLTAGVLTVADGAATYAVTADDVITWIVF